MIDSLLTLLKIISLFIDPERVREKHLEIDNLAWVPVRIATFCNVLRLCPGNRRAHFGLNYGFNKLRFVSPVPVNSRIRGAFYFERYRKEKHRRNNNDLRSYCELENQEKPILAAEWITKAFVKP